MMRVNALCCELVALMSHFNVDNSVKFGVLIIFCASQVAEAKFFFNSNVHFCCSSMRQLNST